MESNKEVISRLKFIGKIQKGEKINSRLMYVQQCGLITQFARTFLQDNRCKTLTFIQDTITRSFELISCYDKSSKFSDIILCNKLIQDLKKSKVGIVNLKETYLDDIKFCCDLETLNEVIDAKLLEYEKTFKNSYDENTFKNDDTAIINEEDVDI